VIRFCSALANDPPSTVIAEQKRQEVEIFQIEKSERARLQKIEIERPKILLMKQVMKNQFVGRELIQEVMDREWAIIKDSGVLDHMVPDPNHQSEIKDFFIRNFIELSDMYKVSTRAPYIHIPPIGFMKIHKS
jgi:hypothetical protein